MIINFNKNWKFTSSAGESYTVHLPHDAMLKERRYAECRNGVQCGYFAGGKYVYENVLTVDEGMLDKSIELLFEGVYRNATVYLNGEKICYHAYGYTEFYVDLTGKVCLGENEIRVEVDNSLIPNSRWYTGSGIYRPVSLIVREKNYIKDLTVRTISIAPAVIEVSARADEEIKVEIFDGNEFVTQGSLGRIEIPNAKLWSAENPHLYTLVAYTDSDTCYTKFGIRSLEWSAERGLLVNGERVLLRGGCIHHDNGVLGACTYPEAEERRVRILKEQGFNALRMAHNPCSRALLDACDKLGMYVMDEAYDGWYIPKEHHDYSRDIMDNYQADLTSMVKKDINHPSVIMYSIGNEVTESAEEKGIRLAGKMRSIVNRLDPTRPVTCGVNVLLDFYCKMGIGVYKDKGDYRREPLPEGKSYKEKKSGSTLFNEITNKLGPLFFFISKLPLSEKLVRDFAPSVDVTGLNYASSRYDIDVKKYPDRMMLGAETMVHELPYNWERVKKYPSVFGDFVWAAWDYLGEACIGDWTYHSYKGLPLLAGQGIIDITGLPLASTTFMQVVWGDRKNPYICVRPINHADETPTTGAWQFTNALRSWTWQGYEGKTAIVEVFSQGESIELSLNGKSLGRKKLKKFRTKFKTKYESGELVAVSYDESGIEIGRDILISGGEETKLTLKCDKNTLREGEIAHIEIEFTDNEGNIKPYIEQRVDLQVEGVKLLGFGSALCKTDEVFDKTYHNSYRGRCFAVVMGKGEAGRITASSNGVKSEIITIN